MQSFIYRQKNCNSRKIDMTLKRSIIFVYIILFRNFLNGNLNLQFPAWAAARFKSAVIISVHIKRANSRAVGSGV